VSTDFSVPTITPTPPRTARFSRTVRGITAFLPGSHKRSASLPPQPPNPRPDLVTFVDDGAPDATHPSSHNAVIVMKGQTTTNERQRRQERHSALIERRAQDVKRGTADLWTGLRYRREQRAGEKHETAFFLPIPYWGVTTYPYGNYGYGGAVCASGGGSAVPGDDGQPGGAAAGVSCNLHEVHPGLADMSRRTGLLWSRMCQLARRN